ncbi:SCO2400 family protein [Streptomyces sp. SYSU K217416]
MDYCHACRRHLNGALACAGCGTPAEELRRTDAVEPAVHHDFDLGVVEPAGHHRASPRPAATRTRRNPGRAAARSRRRRNRKVMFGSLGLVLAAGALSLAELAMEEPGEDRASTVVQEDDVLPDPPVIEPSGIDEPEPVEDVTDEPTVRSSGSADASASAPAGPGPAESAEVLESPSAVPSSQAPDPGPDPDPGPEPDASESRGGPRPSSDPKTPKPAPPPPQADPEPEPEPSETCVRFLWWCA